MARIFEAYIYVYHWLCNCQSYRITNASSLATEVSTGEILVFPFVCEILP